MNSSEVSTHVERASVWEGLQTSWREGDPVLRKNVALVAFSSFIVAALFFTPHLLLKMPPGVALVLPGSCLLGVGVTHYVFHNQKNMSSAAEGAQQKIEEAVERLKKSRQERGGASTEVEMILESVSTDPREITFLKKQFSQIEKYVDREQMREKWENYQLPFSRFLFGVLVTCLIASAALALHMALTSHAVVTLREGITSLSVFSGACVVGVEMADEMIDEGHSLKSLFRNLREGAVKADMLAEETRKRVKKEMEKVGGRGPIEERP